MSSVIEALGEPVKEAGAQAPAGLMAQFYKQINTLIWWGCVYMGVQYAWSQGWLAALGFPPPQPPVQYQRRTQEAQDALDAAQGLTSTSRQAPAPPAPEPDEATAEAHKQAMEAVMARAQEHAMRMNDGKLTVEHMVLALSENPRFGEILQCCEGVTEDHIKSAIKKSRVLFNRGEINEEVIPARETALSKYARDLTAAAREGKLDPVVGRADEIRRVIHILCRRTKNNPVVLGEPGVGKTALVEGLAQRIAAGDVPDALRDVQLMALDMGLLMAGAFMPGEFEERLKGVLKELTENPDKRFVLFIDDLHNVTGPNAQQGGGVMDASVLLKPLLGRGELRCIGATSPDKFKKFIEKDPALERRFQQVVIDPPSVPDSISILRGLRARLERHHAVRVSDAAITAAVNLSDRYIPDRYLPDKALDLVDEACARVRVEISLKPEVLDRLERRISALEGERRLLRRSAHSGGKADALALEELEAELVQLRQERAELFEKYEVEKSETSELVQIQSEIDRLTDEIEAAEDQGNAEEAAALQQAKREELVKKMRTIKAASLARQSPAKGGKGGSKSAGLPLMSRGTVDEPDIARVISTWTGIPLTKLVESELDKVLHLSDELHRRIVGQSEAVAAVAEAIQRSRAGMKDPNGPIASFLFLGPTGVGKTELAKALATALFSAEDSMIRLDMSEFMEKHAVSKLIGAPPGYVGFDEGGQLTEKVRHKPYSVILFDEVEKAHVDVFNVLLQILDDGRVTDGQGRLVSFKNSIIIMTSNLGSQEIYREYNLKGSPALSSSHGPNKERIKDLVMEQVRKHFRPEFVNRVDEFIIFEPLRAEQMAHIVGLRMKGVVSRLAEKRIRMALAPAATEYLAAKGFDPVFGGRPVKRVIQRELETPLARAILRGDFQEEDAVVVGVTVKDDAGGPPELIFTRVAGGASKAGAQALDVAVAAAQARAVAQGLTTSSNGAAPVTTSTTSTSNGSSQPTASSVPNGPASSGSHSGARGAGQNGPSLPAKAGKGSKVSAVASPSSDGAAAGKADGSSAAPVGAGTEASGNSDAQNGENSTPGQPMQGMGARALKFDPLKSISAAASKGDDLSRDGSAARADLDTLPTNCN